MQREVQDDKSVKWQCVQAFSETEGNLAKKAAERMVKENGTVTVVCTPSGGSQSVRLQLNENWREGMSDSELIAAIMSETNR